MAETMQAIVCDSYGPPEVMQLRTVPKPVPRKKEILVRVHTSAVNSADWRLRKPDPWGVRLFLGLTRPRKTLGGVFAGEVVSVGTAVTRFRTGDRIFGSTGMKLGAYAEYLCLDQNAVMTTISAKTDFSAAAAMVFGGFTSMYFLHKAKISAGQQIMIYGASGALGTAAVQLAKRAGAVVTAVCSAGNAELVRQLGADRALDYAGTSYQGDTTLYDVIYDTVGKTSWRDHLPRLKAQATLLLASPGALKSMYLPLLQPFFRPRIFAGLTAEKLSDLEFLRDLAEAGQWQPTIDRTYPLSEIAEAHRYVEAGHKKGNVIVQIIRN